MTNYLPQQNETISPHILCVLNTYYSFKPSTDNTFIIMMFSFSQVSLESEVALDPMAGEQTWPSEQELREAEGE